MSSSPKPELFYFGLRARAEFLRYILLYTGVDFKDHIVDMKEEWPKLKPTMGQVPFYRDEAKKVEQNDSVAIGHYLGLEHNLAGKTNKEQAECVRWGRLVEEMFWKHFDVPGAVFSGEKAKVDTAWTSFLEKYPPFLTKVESTLTATNTGYLVGSGLTWADMYVAERNQYVAEHKGEAIFKGYPKTWQHVQMVHGLKGIKEHAAKRDYSIPL